ncbi:MAG: hypothetical protein ACFFC7_34875 [Candidatus Hermodarchaeota archaeon]
MRVSPKIYLLILALGAVGAFLVYINTEQIVDAFTIFYLSLLLAAGLFLVNQYKQGASLSELKFCILPFYLGLISSIIAGQTSFNGEIITSFIFLGVEFFFNSFSFFFAAPFFTFVLIQLYRHFKQAYSPVKIGGKFINPKEMALIYSLLFLISIIVAVAFTRQLELSTVLFLILVGALFLNFYIFAGKTYSQPRSTRTIRIQPQPRRSSSSSTQRRRTTSNRPARTVTTRSPPQRRSMSDSGGTRVRVTPRASRTSSRQQSQNPQTQSQPRVYSSHSIRQERKKRQTGVRVIPGTGTTRSKSRKRSTTPQTRARRPTAKVTTLDRRIKRKERDLRRYYPKGKHITQEDFKCIFCYEFPIGEEIVLCPHCGRPAHRSEFEMWHTNSNFCSRCSQPVSIHRMIRISDAEYAKVLKNFRTKR